MWDLAALVAAALVCAYWIYADYMHRVEEAHRRREVLEYLDQGMSVLDGNGRITLWNDALERMLQRPQSAALGRLLTDLIPALARTDLPRAIKETIDDREGRILNHLRLTAGTETRIVQVKILPVSGGVSLLWHDVTERAQAEREILQRGERLALAAEGANDGLWQLNLQTREFYVSSRWRAMIGLPPHAAIGGPGEWLDRVHPEDIASLNAALDAHLAGATQVFHHEHRIRHEDGGYRRFLCRGVAVRGAGKKPGPRRGIAHRHDRAGDGAGEAAQRGFQGFAHRHVQPRRVRKRSAAGSTSAGAAAGRWLRRALSDPIGSRSSTTASATWSATSCSSRRHAA
jgi:PAS domain S-box-containing protein